MTGARGRRSGARTEGRRATGRPLSHAASRPVPAGRSGAASRPEQRRPGRRAPRGPSVAALARRPLFTGRAVLLAALVLLLALTLAGPIRQYLAGRAELTRLAAESTALDARIEELLAELERQGDPAYTAREARERLTYVLPGDRLVVVVGGDPAEPDGGPLPDPARSAPVPWYEALMESVGEADGEPAG